MKRLRIFWIVLFLLLTTIVLFSRRTTCNVYDIFVHPSTRNDVTLTPAVTLSDVSQPATKLITQAKIVPAHGFIELVYGSDLFFIGS
jgi:hypothetical protein